MKIALLVICIILLLIYGFIMIDTIILVLKSKGKRISGIRDILMRRVNASIILTVVIAVLILLRILVFK